MSEDMTESLVNAGISENEARRKSQLFARVERELLKRADCDVMRWFVPGRIEVLGKHTDYGGGRSLLCTAERGFCVAAVRRDDSIVRINDVVRRQRLEFAISPDLQLPDAGWRVYPMVVGRRLARNFPGDIRGADIGFANDLPSAAGMSTSSALVVAIFAVLSALNRLSERAEYDDVRDVEDLAGYLGCIENGQTYKSLAGDSGVGTFGGSEDHTAILTSEPGRLKQYSFCPVRLERTIPMPAGCVFVIGVSGVVASKTGSARALYNRASQATRAIMHTWRSLAGSHEATLAAVAKSSDEALDRLRYALGKLDDEAENRWLVRRFEQFMLESETIIPQAADALADGRLADFGSLVDRSQAAAEELLGNQVPETVWLAKQARTLGAYAASAFGAGFGGSVWALVPRSEAQEFAQGWRQSYAASSHPAAARSQFFVTAAGAPMIRL